MLASAAEPYLRIDVSVLKASRKQQSARCAQQPVDSIKARQKASQIVKATRAEV
jgi:hypothetical protein